MKYFAYGSNLDVLQMKRRCPPASVHATGYVFRYRLDFGYESKNWRGGVATIVPAPEHVVWGIVYEIDSQCLDVLDTFEGYPNVYTRDLFTVQLAQGHCEAWAYFLARAYDYVAPSESYLTVILDACTRFNFPADYRAALLRAATARPNSA